MKFYFDETFKVEKALSFRFFTRSEICLQIEKTNLRQGSFTKLLDVLIIVWSKMCIFYSA
jgi:hypothetical protein